MKKNRVKICMGTACYVMGSTQLLRLEEEIGPDLCDLVEVEGVRCLGYCEDSSRGRAPFVTVDDECIADATVETVLEALRRRREADDEGGAS
ncbi:hypothetical protein AU468_02280 [Alkalispirochaeta sphaeroplastigenens]|uniref:NADH dehydrogenase n=1 Tax=Alkalispirochaeta sphaeroplastigenens TaxID=1187066 RepID=A0A2S4K0A1_9SPIO|nr:MULTISPECIES: NAD(P)H-dependent oxidoreductase subunit E [Alkalispirochaeta]POR05194.1 hypothetical protein AU468_02280 [Alkalispirochaeta sphaeroplastigenens]